MLATTKRIVRGAFHLAGFEIYSLRHQKQSDTTPPVEVNQVMPDVSADEGLQALVASRVEGRRVVRLGSPADLAAYAFLGGEAIEWQWDADVTLPDEADILICSIPLAAEHWRAISSLKQRYGARVIGVQELVLPFTAIIFARQRLNYHAKTLAELGKYYLGREWFGNFNDLNELCPLAGKRIIEFGPFDGAQTAGLVHHGANEVVCIEARAENFIKTLIAKEVLGWHNVRLVADDMHNADVIKYGRFDLAFCHGVYYHTIAPFVFLENLVGLSDNIFVGGFVLKEDAPFEVVEQEGESYRVQPYEEVNLDWFTAGINKTSYYFHPEDLMKFFRLRGYGVTKIDDYEMDIGSGRFYRFLASRASV